MKTFNSKYILGCLIAVFFTLQSQNVFATHLVGGSITYDCLGPGPSNTTRYRIRVEIYQDCINGLPAAINEDYPAYVGIFSGNGALLLRDSIGNFSGGRVDSFFVPPNFQNECVNNPPSVCLKRVRFEKEYNFPSNTDGYRVMFVRCCRNEAILNLNNPGQVGTTFFCEIPPNQEVVCNTSAVFENLPPQIICINNPLVYDHSAFDADGDSLSYEFCDAYPGGMTTSPKPFPDGMIPKPLSTPNASPPSYGYRAGFTPARPMGGNPLISIDPVTGVITGTPNLLGRYVVSVCVHEWRNGVIINTSRREFQFAVTNCSKKVIADIPQFSDEYNTYIVECRSKTVNFINNSSGGFRYNWDFGVPGGTSTEFQPSFTYPDTGTYRVSLVVNEGSTCPDSIWKYVKIYPDYEANYDYDGLQCPNTEMSFTDLSAATYEPITDWMWNFGDGNTSSEQNPKHIYELGGEYNVTLISKSILGCTDTISKTIKVEDFQPFAGNDTIIVKGESIYFDAEGGVEYRWSPGDRLSATTIGNPVGYYPDTGYYNYNVFIRSPFGCQGNDSIQVRVVGQPSLFVPTAFSPNGDGLNDYLRPLSVGYSQYTFFRVFNRWGEMVFSTDQIGPGWDGTYKGKKADVGTYFWVLGVVDRNGQEDKIKGDATLIR